MVPTSEQKVSPRPGFVLTALLFSLAVLAWPVFLEKIISLEWRIGDIRPIAYRTSVILGLATAGSLLTRRWINSLFAKAFPIRKRQIFVLIALSLSLVVGGVAAEVGLRFLDLPFRLSSARAEVPLAQFDPELGWTYMPNRSVVQKFGLAHREVTMHFDDIGSRVRAPGVRHDPAAPTVLFVGDSITFGHGVPYEETFTGRLESMPDFPLQVVNLGVQAYSTGQSLLMLKRFFKAFRTQAVVYTFLDVHILRNAVYDRRLINPHAIFLGTAPLFARKSDGSVYLQRKPIRYEDYGYPRLRALFQVVRTGRGPKPSTALTCALVQEMKNYVESNGATFYVLNWDQGVYWDPPPTLRPGESIFRGMSLNLIDTTIDPPSGWSSWIILGDGHADGRAHAYVARLLAEELERRFGKRHKPFCPAKAERLPGRRKTRSRIRTRELPFDKKFSRTNQSIPCLGKMRMVFLEF